MTELLVQLKRYSTCQHNKYLKNLDLRSMANIVLAEMDLSLIIILICLLSVVFIVITGLLS